MILGVIILLLISELLAMAGQVLYKKSLNKIKAGKYLKFLKTALTSSKIWTGFSLIAISVVIWLAALSITDLNLLNSLNSMQYLLILGASRVFLGEKIDRHKLMGTIFVALGILLVILS
jgi:drug/metabolite transporter (DMT)-like permease